MLKRSPWAQWSPRFFIREGKCLLPIHRRPEEGEFPVPNGTPASPPSVGHTGKNKAQTKSRSQSTAQIYTDLDRPNLGLALQQVFRQVSPSKTSLSASRTAKRKYVKHENPGPEPEVGQDGIGRLPRHERLQRHGARKHIREGR